MRWRSRASVVAPRAAAFSAVLVAAARRAVGGLPRAGVGAIRARSSATIYALLRRFFLSVRALVPLNYYVAALPVVLDVMMQRDGAQAV